MDETAKEMFQKLYFNQTIFKDRIMYKDALGKQIDFYLIGKTYGWTGFIIYPKLHKAINKQMIELGLLDEEEN